MVAQARSGQATERRLPDGLFGYVWRESRRHQLWLCLLAGAVFPLTMAPLELQKRIVDHAIGDQNLDLLWLLGGVYFVVVLLQGGLKYALRWYRGLVGERAIRRLRARVRQAHDREAAGDDNEAGRGESVSIVSTEVERVGGFIGESFSEPVLQIGIFISLLGYMLVVQTTIALVSLAFFVPQAIFVPLLQRVANRRAQRKVQLVRGLGELLVVPDRDQGASYRDGLDDVYRVRLQYYALKFLIKFLNNLLNQVAPISVLMVGGYLAIQGATTIGTVVAFISGFQRLADPSRELLAWYRLEAETRVQYRLIAKWLAG
jgi:ABC-type bacteriocin/lantibiotic exporter with double-glycine peptidase domain